MREYVKLWCVSRRNMVLIILVVLNFLVVSQARQGFGPGEQDWGYVTVRPGAHMFWWLYYTTANVSDHRDRPLVVWLQGGPGASSTGYGNFLELGPLDLYISERNFTWVKDVNVLFVDNPVGAGFSYVESKKGFATTNNKIAVDFVELLRGFYAEHPKFKHTPLYIVSESYGGKMAIEIALMLDKAIKIGRVQSNFIGIGLGDPWVDPITTVLEWASYLLAIGAVDRAGHDIVAATALKTKQLFDQGLYRNSTIQWIRTQFAINKLTADINYLNILKAVAVNDSEIDKLLLEAIMSTVANDLALNVSWGSQKNAVFKALFQDFMKNVTAVTEKLLDNTDIKVAVYNGQLDLIVCTNGIIKWLDNLKWSKSREWAVAERSAFSVRGFYEGYQKVAGNLAMFWVNRAGHSVPLDNPAAMDYILRWLTNDYDGLIKRL